MANEERAGLWKTLNSPIVVLLISTVLIGGIGFLIKDHLVVGRDQDKRREVNALALQSISVELMARARQMETISESGDSWTERLASAQAVYYGRDRSRGARPYENRSVSDLLLEFDRIAGLPLQTQAVNRFERMLSMETLAKRDLPSAAARLRYCINVRINALGRNELPLRSAGERNRVARNERHWFACAA
ncbi:MAG TPA: hypothetical protein VEA44_18930 [Caulobacter sp.]|nr:hypothetical protein [Caulobacter sp.]